MRVIILLTLLVSSTVCSVSSVSEATANSLHESIYSNSYDSYYRFGIPLDLKQSGFQKLKKTLTTPKQRKLSVTDKTLEITWQIIHFIDWGQTLEIARQPDRYFERNKILGSHPSVGEVNTYMAITAVTHAVVSYLLPKKYRKYWQHLTIYESLSCVVNNFNLGLRVRF
jgi:hypothetical protein